MKFIKNRKGAALIAVVVVMLATLFGMNRSLGEAVAKVSDQFYNGVGALETATSNINNQLIVRCNAGNNFLSYAYAYRDEIKPAYDAFRSAWSELSNSREEKAGPALLYRANETYQSAADDLYNALIRRDLSETERNAVEQEYIRMANAARVISKSKYNETVREFDSKIMSAFPVNVLGRLAFVSEPELFE